MASLIGNPQDVLSTPYGYSGQFSPETAVQEQALNRRRLLANMLTQQGMQQPQGQMAGRFYVAPSPLQHGANLASMLAGVLSGNYIDKKQGELAKADREAYQAAIRGYLDKTNPQAQSMAAPQPQADAGQAAPPASEEPYTGQVGAVPMPEPRVQSDKPPIESMRPQSQAGIEGMQGLDMENIQPADMSQAAGQAPPPGMDLPPPMPEPAPGAEPAPPMPEPVPQMPQATTPVMTQGQPVDKRRALAELMMQQHPMVQRFAEMEMRRLAAEDEKNANREFLSEQKALDRDVRREGIESSALMRAEMIRGNMINTQAQIDARLQAGRDANDLKAELARQQTDLKKELARQQTDLKKEEITSRADTARQHDATLKAIAGMTAGNKQEAAALKRQDKAVEAQTNVDMAVNTLSKTRDKARELLNHKGLSRITGLMGALPNIPGGDAANAEANLDQLKSMASVQMINDLRQASKTGGAVGQVTEREWGYLQNAAARLQKTQGTPAFKQALESYITDLDRVEKLITGAYKRQFGGEQEATEPSAPASPKAERSLDELLKKYGN